MSTKKIQILNGASIIPKPDQTYSADSENAQSGKAVAEAISKIGGGKGIASIEKTSTSGLIDTYTITYTDDTTSTFELTNGKEITDISIGYISSDSAETMAITINDSVFSATNYNKLSDITKNIDTKSIDLNITNNSDNIYSIRYFTYREEMDE